MEKHHVQREQLFYKRTESESRHSGSTPVNTSTYMSKWQNLQLAHRIANIYTSKWGILQKCLSKCSQLRNHAPKLKF